MNKMAWIIAEIGRDLVRYRNNIFIIIGLFFAVILFGKVLKHFGLEVLFVPVVIIGYILWAIYNWYSMSYKNEQNKIIEKLKGKR